MHMNETLYDDHVIAPDWIQHISNVVGVVVVARKDGTLVDMLWYGLLISEWQDMHDHD